MSTVIDTQFAALPSSISQYAAGHPEHPAIITASHLVDYGELDRRSNRLARRLQSAGAGPGTLVGLWLDRSAEFVVGALAILKTGAAYAPLDPSYPAARLEFIAGDAGLPLIVTSRQTAGAGARMPGRLVYISAADGADADDLAREDASDLGIAIGPDDRAYVIYTSGTTGQPKGVEITHGSLQNLVRWHTRAFSVSQADRATLLANVGFDADVWELWPHLASGCTVFVPGAELIRDPESLREWLVKNGITITFMPTLLAGTLMKMPWPASTPLRFMLTGGDRLHDYPGADLPFTLVNNYGPAECTVVSTSGVVPVGADLSQPPSIGRAIDGAQVYILDETLAEVAAGTVGEICVGGAGVGRGYLNRPELTAQKFVTAQIGPNGHTRLYRTGDLGRLAPDGSIQFVGRLDDQVKIRGYRIECGEIEAALNRLPAVAMSAVTARDYGTGDRRLVAYIVPSGEAVLSREELRQALKATLPEYMVPEEMVRMDSLPISENGKIDRRNLPAPSTVEAIADEAVSDDPIEAELIEILKKLLHVEHIGREDNFFLLGGHSFIAAQVIARIRSHFDVNLSLRTVFDHPTPAGMAAQIEQRILAKMAVAN